MAGAVTGGYYGINYRSDISDQRTQLIDDLKVRLNQPNPEDLGEARQRLLSDNCGIVEKRQCTPGERSAAETLIWRAPRIEAEIKNAVKKFDDDKNVNWALAGIVGAALLGVYGSARIINGIFFKPEAVDTDSFTTVTGGGHTFLNTRVPFARSYRDTGHKFIRRRSPNYW